MIDFSKLDRTIHEKGRLSIMTLLAARERWAFAALKEELGMSDGNLITHLRALGKVGYVAKEKEEGPGRPRTLYRITKEGDAAFRDYIDLLEQIVAHNRPD